MQTNSHLAESLNLPFSIFSIHSLQPILIYQTSAEWHHSNNSSVSFLMNSRCFMPYPRCKWILRCAGFTTTKSPIQKADLSAFRRNWSCRWSHPARLHLWKCTFIDDGAAACRAPSPDLVILFFPTYNCRKDVLCGRAAASVSAPESEMSFSSTPTS